MPKPFGYFMSFSFSRFFLLFLTLLLYVNCHVTHMDPLSRGKPPGLALPTGAVTWAPRSPRWHATINLKLLNGGMATTPLKINVDQNHGGVIFLSKWVICRFHVNFPGCSIVFGDHLMHCASVVFFFAWAIIMIHPWLPWSFGFYVPIPCWWHNRSVRNQPICEIPRVEFQVVVWNHETSTGFVPSLSWSMLTIYIDLLVSKIKLE